MSVDHIASRAPATTSRFAFVVLAIGALTFARIVGLQFSSVDLFYDEAQYWAWSQELAAGYFSKPPLLAWIIAATNAACGTGEACVRLASPIVYFAASLLLYALANELYGMKAAGWAALTFAAGTGLAFSARIISTDVPLIFCWILALLAYVKLLQGSGWRWAFVLGTAVGFGLLAKYAMAYFLLCAGCAALIDRSARDVWTRPHIWVALALAAAIFSPNAYWNAVHDLATVRHTEDNLVGNGLSFRPNALLAFIASQFALAGPFVFAGFLIALVRARIVVTRPADRVMLAFAAPPLAIIVIVALLRGANANWAAVAIPAMTVLVVAWWERANRLRWSVASIVVGAFAQMMLIFGDAYAYRIQVPFLGARSDIYSRTLGWRALGEQTAKFARHYGASTVAVEGRAETASLIYYLRDEKVRTFAWPAGDVPQHHFEMTRALDNSAVDPILLVSACPLTARLMRSFNDVRFLGPLTTAAGPNAMRIHYAFLLADRSGPIRPLGPCIVAPDKP